MKKLFLFGAVALIILTTVSCEETQGKKIISDCDCLEGISFENDLNNEPAIIKFDAILKTYVIILEDSNKFKSPLKPCNNSLDNKYNIKDLKIYVSGYYKGCNEWNKPNIKQYGFALINISSIKKR